MMSKWRERAVRVVTCPPNLSVEDKCRCAVVLHFTAALASTEGR